MIWSKQFFYYDVPQWLKGDPGAPPPPAERKHGRNHEWAHLNNADIISMPDKWEYPWYAAWDLAFHTHLAGAGRSGIRQRTTGAADARVVHASQRATAGVRMGVRRRESAGAWLGDLARVSDGPQAAAEDDPDDPGDLAFLERVFHKLMLNFTWWVNRKDAEGRNIFQGGFLGLDNIGVFDRSAPLPTGGYINQSDGTSWMAMYSLNLMRIALELAQHNHVYEDIATKFFEHFLHIAEAMTNIGEQGIGLWDDEDGFYYDVLNLPDGADDAAQGAVDGRADSAVRGGDARAGAAGEGAGVRRALEWFLKYRPDLAALVSRWNEPGKGERRLLSLLRGSRMKKLLRRMLDETEFLSDYGVRAHLAASRRASLYVQLERAALDVAYQPGESTSGLFGGNSNWRGPIWMPVNYLIIESLQKFHHYYGDDFKVECPTGSGNYLTIDEVAAELSRRLRGLFLRNADGATAVPWRLRVTERTIRTFADLILFHEYFHGDTGRGVGASHQTGWTGLVAKLLQPRTGYLSRLPKRRNKMNNGSKCPGC